MANPSIIAVVDDEEEVRLATCGLLRSYGVRVLVFDSAEAFLAGADLAEIDGLITDLAMPGMSGAALLEALRGRGAAFPVIITSGLDAEPTRSRALTHGPVAFLTKPVDPIELINTLEQLLSTRWSS